MPNWWIRQWGDPALHERARPVKCFDDLLRAQVYRMRNRLVEANGAGLAATQVGLLRRPFVFRATPDDDVEVVVNPRVIAASAEQGRFYESCLSFNTIGVEVVRPMTVRIVGQDVEGRARELEGDGYVASLLQHEIDHLDGILTLDRAARPERQRAVAALLQRREAHPAVRTYAT